MTVNLVLCDDHPIVLAGLESLFRLEEDFQVLARCINGEEALAAIRQHNPDILVVDMHIPGAGGDGLEILRTLRREKLPTKAVMLAAALEEDEIVEALRLGVRGVVLKELAPQLLVECIRKVYAGEQWIDKQLSNLALEALLRRETAGRPRSSVLSPRETEIVRMVAGGLGNKELAERLGVSEGTIKIHLHNIYKKLKVHSRLELVLHAQTNKLV
ncbi:MAG TPA: response regulator transcription factor [Gemmatimonadales bacterium]|nr:response regulator transcription factor [Gemmatimonadales bacterium]